MHGVTRTPAKAAAFAECQGLTLSDDYDAALADPSNGAAVLATQHSQHAAQIEAAAAAGKPVFVEKPLTLTRTSAVAAAEAAGIVLAAGHNRRFLPATAMVKRMIEEGTLGTVLQMEGNLSGPWGFDYRAGMWRADQAESPAGGMTAILLSHAGFQTSRCSAEAAQLREVARGTHPSVGTSGFVLSLNQSPDVREPYR